MYRTTAANDAEAACVYSALTCTFVKKTGKVGITEHTGELVQPLLPWKSNEYYTTSACAFVALGVRHAKCMLHFVLWPAPLYKVFPHYLINDTTFEEKKNY